MAAVSVRIPNDHSRTADQDLTRARTRGKRRPLPHGTPGHWRRVLVVAGAVLMSIALLISSPLLRPYFAEELAEAIPASWLKDASESVQRNLDGTLLSAAQSPADRRESLAARFAALRAPASGALPYRLQFRQSRTHSAISYALPDGTIIVTDELLSLLPDDREVLALLCRELGHLHYRHLLRASLEHDFLRLGALTLLGREQQAVPRLADSLLAAELGADAQLAADRFAQRMLEANGMPRQHLALALTRLAQAAGPQRKTFLLQPASAEQYAARLRALDAPRQE